MTFESSTSIDSIFNYLMFWETIRVRFFVKFIYNAWPKPIFFLDLKALFNVKNIL